MANISTQTSTTTTIRTHILGFPRMGVRRELKFALESFWRGEVDQAYVEQIGADLKNQQWQLQQASKLSFTTVGDFAYYDHVLNMTVLLGALPKRFGFGANNANAAKNLSLAEYSQLARGNKTQHAMEMTKWFDTNYHYLVPELAPDTTFEGGNEWLFDDVREALKNGSTVKSVLIGPVTYLWLSKTHVPGFDRLTLLPGLIKAYQRILHSLATLGVEWVQMDEPALVMELPIAWRHAYETAYEHLSHAGVKLLLTTYFDDASDHIEQISRLPVDGFHIDVVRAPHQLKTWLDHLPASAVLSVGIIDGRNIWRTDLRRALTTLAPLKEKLADRLWIAPSCSLLHVPQTLATEMTLDIELKSWLAFAHEKLDELNILQRALNDGEQSVTEELHESDRAQASRRASSRVTNQLVQKNVATINDAMSTRTSPFGKRIQSQRERLPLPLLPTTTIGSFPQTPHIRQVRAAYKRGEIKALDYLERIRAEIRFAVERQEELGLDVLVHGEAERNDMVEYFGERLWGFAFTDNGWVQSYGSRCVKPPIIYGDVYRPEAMTVETTQYAQSLTAKPMKGMLTGPVTMLQWSFVRDDQAREVTATQLALAIRDEVADLERAGIGIIQIDEPAFREGLPLKARDWPRYLAWAVHAFKLSAAVVGDSTQIHTHMCYSEFNDILPSIAAMDADVITIETSRSNMELLNGFAAFKYPNEIGPGVYDIHSPRVPDKSEMVRLLMRACTVIPADRLWVNPDCGLKTRNWPETESALRNMIQATREMRAKLAETQAA